MREKRRVIGGVREVIRAKGEENLKKDKWPRELNSAETQRRSILH